jgi:hypothetical protein
MTKNLWLATIVLLFVLAWVLALNFISKSNRHNSGLSGPKAVAEESENNNQPLAINNQINRLPGNQSEQAVSANKPENIAGNIINQPTAVQDNNQTIAKQTKNQAVVNSLESSNQEAESEIIQDNSNTSAIPDTADSYHIAMTTYFWVGEGASQDNSNISNAQSYWDEKWLEHFGGVDEPSDRCGYLPCAFRPKENPFYFALPYGDYDEDGNLKASVKQIPWYRPGSGGQSIIKNHWIEIKYKNNICYAQWEDVGPYQTDDFAYVFGSQPAKNKAGVGAGLDLSPAGWDCLGLKDNDVTEWRFIEAAEVPPGPWQEIVTR